MTSEVPKLPVSAEKTESDARKESEFAEVQAIRALVTELRHSPEADCERLSKILDLMPSYVVLLNNAGKILFKNKAFDDFFGKESSDYCYKAMRGFDERCQFCPPLDALKSQASCVMEWVSPINQHAFRVYCYPFEEAEGTWLTLKVGSSVTANLRVRQALDLSESSYRAITDNLSIGIAVLTLDLKVNAGNSRLAQWFGQGLVRGTRVCEVLQCFGVVSEEGKFCAGCPFTAALDDKASHELEFSVTMQDRRTRTVRIVACPVTPRRGNVRALILMIEDISKRLEVNRQLQRVRKLEALSALSAGIAHEINQPLSALHLYASGLQMMLEKQNGEVSPAVTLERLELIMREAEKIRSIITNMRALVTKEGTVVEEVYVQEAIVVALGIMEHQITSRNIFVVRDVADDLPPVRSNRVQLEQVLINLLSNAVHAVDSIAAEEATPPKKKTRSLEGEKVIRILASLSADRKNVQVSIADSGLGLPDAREKIFDPFFTTKGESKGMGLGLSIVHGLVQQWGGEISARAKSDLGGAEFYLLLQKAYAQAKPVQRDTNLIA